MDKIIMKIRKKIKIKFLINKIKNNLHLFSKLSNLTLEKKLTKEKKIKEKKKINRFLMKEIKFPSKKSNIKSLFLAKEHLEKCIIALILKLERFMQSNNFMMNVIIRKKKQTIKKFWIK